MEDTPRPVGEEGTEDAVASSPAETKLESRVVGATAWTFGSLGGMYILRAVSQIVLAHLLVPSCWGVIAILRTFLIAVEMLSDVGIRGSVVFHEKGTTRSFLNTAWTLQMMRGVGMWIATCALAWPVATWYEEPLLLWLLPIAGLESINNGLLSVGIYSRQRKLKLGLPIILDWIGLVVSIVTSVIWASISPSVWALAAGPLVGGVAKTTASHLLVSEIRLRPQWDREAARALIHFGKWIYVGTVAAFLAQYFLTLYLGKLVPLAILGIYQIAWNLVSQAGKPLTMLSNQVLIPLFAESGRVGPKEHAARVNQAIDRFLPTCLLIVVGVAMICPAFIGYFYPASYGDGGTMGRFCAVVVWFLILQHLPRGVMLSLGHSKGVCSMSVANAVVTIAGCVAGYAFGADLGIGPIRGAILGGALGNGMGCVVGARLTQRLGLSVGRPMLQYSFTFVSIFLSGIVVDECLQAYVPDMTPVLSSLIVTFLAAVPLTFVLWQRTVKIWLDQRRSTRARTASE
jgi:O-antigen/teichoic acid export membrane protein